MAGTSLFGNFEGFDHFDDFLRKSFGGQPSVADAAPAAPPTHDEQVRANASKLKYSAGSAATTGVQALTAPGSESAAALESAAAARAASAAPAAPGMLARAFPTIGPAVGKAVGFGAKMLGPVAAAAAPAVEGYGVYQKTQDPNASGIDVATQAAEGTSRAAGSIAGAKFSAMVPGPGIVKGLAGIAGGIGGYFAPNAIFALRDMMRGTGGATPAVAPTVASAAAPVDTGAPSTIDNMTGQVIPDTPIVSSYGAPPAVAPGTAPVAAPIAPAPVAPRVIGNNAFGIPEGNVAGAVQPVRAPDGSIVYTNFGAKAPVVAAAPATSNINPATNLPYSSTIVPGNMTGRGNPSDVLSYLGNVRNYVASRGAERELEKRDIATKSVKVAEIKAKSDIDKIRESEAGKPIVLPNAAGGSTLIHPASKTFYKTDSTGNITVGKIGGALPTFNETGVKSIVASMRRDNPTATPSQIRAKLQELYKDKDIPTSWIK